MAPVDCAYWCLFDSDCQYAGCNDVFLAECGGTCRAFCSCCNMWGDYECVYSDSSKWYCPDPPAACVAGYYSNGGVCTACPSHTTSAAMSASVTDCKCVKGYSGADGGPCTACSPGTYKAISGSGSCTSCPAHSSSASGSDGLTDCKCVAGYTGTDGAACTACEVGSYKAVSGSSSCATCPAHTSSAGGSDALTDCTCLAGHSASSDGVACTACTAGSYSSCLLRSSLELSDTIIHEHRMRALLGTAAHFY